MNIDINNLTLRQIKEINSLSGKDSSRKVPFIIGECYFIREVTHYNLGRVKEIYDDFLVLEEASWVTDTKRFCDFLKNGKTDGMEIEPYHNDCIVGLGAIVDATPWHNNLLIIQV